MRPLWLTRESHLQDLDSATFQRPDEATPGLEDDGTPGVGVNIAEDFCSLQLLDLPVRRTAQQRTSRKLTHSHRGDGGNECMFCPSEADLYGDRGSLPDQLRDLSVRFLLQGGRQGLHYSERFRHPGSESGACGYCPADWQASVRSCPTQIRRLISKPSCRAFTSNCSRTSVGSRRSRDRIHR